MKNLLLTITIILFSFSMMGQKTFTTNRALIEYPEIQSTTIRVDVKWEIYQDSLVMKYIKPPKHIEETEKTFVMELQTLQSPYHYIYQSDNKRIEILTTDERSVVLVEERDDFGFQIKKEMYY